MESVDYLTSQEPCPTSGRNGGTSLGALHLPPLKFHPLR